LGVLEASINQEARVPRGDAYALGVLQQLVTTHLVPLANSGGGSFKVNGGVTTEATTSACFDFTVDVLAKARRDTTALSCAQTSPLAVYLQKTGALEEGRGSSLVAALTPSMSKFQKLAHVLGETGV
jgi:hypothetical protein